MLSRLVKDMAKLARLRNDDVTDSSWWNRREARRLGLLVFCFQFIEEQP